MLGRTRGYLFIFVENNGIFRLLQEFLEDGDQIVAFGNCLEGGDGSLRLRVVGQCFEDFELLGPLLDGDADLLFNNAALDGVGEVEVGHSLVLVILDEA